MNRKLHHSLIAAMTCSAALAVVLLASTPLDAEPLPTVAASSALTQASPASHRAGGRTLARSHQSVRMPFFSFFIPKD